jgi:hypothetical protein
MMRKEQITASSQCALHYTILPFATRDSLPAISFTITAELIFKDILC